MSRKKGSKNKSVKGKVFHAGKHWTIKNLAREYNLDYDDLYKSIAVEGQRPGKAIAECEEIKQERFHQKLNTGRHEHMGTNYTLKQWSISASVNYSSLRYHVIKKGRSVGETIRILKKGAK